MAKKNFFQNNPYNYQNPYKDQTDYYSKYSSGYEKAKKDPVITGLEAVLVLFSVLLLAGSFGFGVINSRPINQDKKKRHDINQIIAALDMYYINSDSIENKRTYPVAVCADQANEIDFEYTLRNHLSGQNQNENSHAFIPSELFPRDDWGRYSIKFENRQVPFDCAKEITHGANGEVYPNGYPSCNFSLSRKDFQKCYLYGSSVNGDSYKLVYYSEANDYLVRIDKFRDEDIKQSIIKI